MIKNMDIILIQTKTTKMIYQTKENFTPAGCVGPILANNYIIGGAGPYLSFFDIGKKDFVWRYKHNKKTVLFSGVYVTKKDLLIAYSNEKKELYWFKSNS